MMLLCATPDPLAVIVKAAAASSCRPKSTVAVITAAAPICSARGACRPVGETGRRDKLGVLTAASETAPGKGSIGVLVGGHNLTLRKVRRGPAGNGDRVDLCDLQGQIARVLDRKAQSSAWAELRICRVIRDE